MSPDAFMDEDFERELGWYEKVSSDLRNIIFNLLISVLDIRLSVDRKPWATNFR